MNTSIDRDTNATRYYAGARREILPFLPPSPRRLLELGCAEGGTIAAIKAHHPHLWAAGVEQHAPSAETARTHVDQLWQGTVEGTPWTTAIAPASLDVVLCLDVLEHLVDPWHVVQQLSPLLATGGRLIVSVPNVRQWKFVLKLLLLGDFRYRDAGLLDRTHLRFFTRETGIELVTCGGLMLTHAVRAHDWRFPDPRYLLSCLTGRRADNLTAKQWILVAEQCATSAHFST